MKKKMVWIISYFAGGPSYCPRIPDYGLAKYLQEHGYESLIFAGSALHNTDINFITDDKIYCERMVDDVPFVYIHTRSYKDKTRESLSFIDFYFNMMKCYKYFDRPDIIMAAMPQPLSCLAGYGIAKKYHIPYITSIVDLWPLSIVEYANFSDRHPVIKAMYAYEKWLYIKSDELVFTWEGAYDYIIDKGWDKKIPKRKFHYINIGVNLKEFYKNMEQYQIDDPDLQDDKFRVVYCGSVRTANDIGTVVSCAKRLNEDGCGDRLRFIIYGDGPDREILERRCKEENIPNVIFKGSIEKKYIPYVLSRSQLNVLNLKSAKTQKYGNSSNKLFEYLAAGNPVIANIDEGKYPIITKYGCGKVIKAGALGEYANGIKYFLNLCEEEMARYKANALKAAELFDTDKMNDNWEQLIRKNLEARGGYRKEIGRIFREVTFCPLWTGAAA